MILLPTVQHTGTNFVAHLFLDKGCGWGTLDNPSQGFVNVGHILPTNTDRILELAQEWPVVLPVRHPYRVYESWRRKGKDHKQMLWAYQWLIDNLDGHFLSVDAKNREELLKKAGETFGPFETQWKVVCSQSGTHALPLERIEVPDDVQAFFQQDFFKPFYG